VLGHHVVHIGVRVQRAARGIGSGPEVRRPLVVTNATPLGARGAQGRTGCSTQRLRRRSW
jgi:hypothetical protein